MSGDDLIWATFEGGHRDIGPAPTRAEQIAAALEQLAELAAEDPSLMGMTLILPSGERLDFMADRERSPLS